MLFKGCYDYILRIYPKANFSPIYYQKSAVKGGVNAATKDHAASGAVAILIHSIQWESTAAAGTITATFTDAHTQQVLLSQKNQGGYNQKQYFSFAVVETSDLNIICNDATVTFIVEYQFLNDKTNG